MDRRPRGLIHVSCCWQGSFQHERETVRRPTSHERAVRVLRLRQVDAHALRAYGFIPPYRSSKTTRALRAGLRLGPHPDTTQR